LIFLNNHLLWLYSPYMNLFGSRHQLGESFALESIEKKAKEEVVDFILSLKPGKSSSPAKQGYLPNEETVRRDQYKMHLDASKLSEMACNDYTPKIEETLPKQIFPPLPVDERAVPKKLVTEKQLLAQLKVLSDQATQSWPEEIKKSLRYPNKQEEMTYQLPIDRHLIPSPKEAGKIISFSLEEDAKVLLQKYLRKQHQTLFMPKGEEIISTWLVPSILPTFKDLKTTAYNEEFDVSVSYSPLDSEEGYLFAVTVIPKTGKRFCKLPQNYYFLLDSSNSIQKYRLNKTRHALTSALPFLKRNDRFNVTAFDHQHQKLFDVQKRLNQETYKVSRRFLLDLSLGSFFISTDFFHPLYSLFAAPINEKEMQTVILMTNGEDLHKNKSINLLEKWTSLNQGLFSLFVVALDSDKNKSYLEMFAKRNNGILVTAESPLQLKRQLQKLMKTINYPIARDIVATVYRAGDSNSIEISPSLNQLPHLYANQPFVLIGKTHSLEDFFLFLQGKNRKGWFHLKKNISFKEATPAGHSLQRQWALLEAYDCYSKYFASRRPEHLQKAKQILSPYGLKPLFE